MILVTGSRGLLGREIVQQAVQREWWVRGVDLLERDGGIPETYEQVQADLRDPVACDKVCKGVEVVIHTAALQHHSDPPKFGRKVFFRQNITMTQNVADAAVRAGVRYLVFVSSDMVYGLPSGRPLHESDAPNPIGPYGWSKLASEKVCLAKRCAGLKVAIFRPRLIVGPGRLGVLTKLFDRIRRGQCIPLIGNGTNRYQMVAVQDLANAITLAVLKQMECLYNVGSHDVPTVATLLNNLVQRVGSPSKMMRTPRSFVISVLAMLHAIRMAPLVPEQFRIAGVDYVLDTSAIEAGLGWTPQFNDAEMLWQAYTHYISLGDRG